ncbi:hypothetical protein [Micromonospora sp. NPDC051006]|uniref:hypothetical protein n=1 Tax=Micromonospora sp. NPDC051006 TaxID=3364283 RepID=UPI0037B7AA15
MRSRWGRYLLLCSAAGMTVAPWLADWNRRHTFGPGYGPHARWHGTAEVVGVSASGLVMLWLLTRAVRHDRRLATGMAALLPLLRYGAFNLTLAVPGTSPDEEGGPPIRLLGLPASLVTQDALIALALGGYLLERHAERL